MILLIWGNELENNMHMFYLYWFDKMIKIDSNIIHTCCHRLDIFQRRFAHFGSCTCAVMSFSDMWLNGGCFLDLWSLRLILKEREQSSCYEGLLPNAITTQQISTMCNAPHILEFS